MREAWDTMLVYDLEREGSRARSSGLQGQGEADAPAQEESSHFLRVSVLRPSGDWMMSTHTGEGRSSFLSLLMPMLALWKRPHSTLRNNASPAIWASLSPVKLTHTIKEHRLPGTPSSMSYGSHSLPKSSYAKGLVLSEHPSVCQVNWNVKRGLL